MKKEFEFIGKATGDGECFAFGVDLETYIRLIGKKEYEEELAFDEEYRKSYIEDGLEPPPKSEIHLIYPNHFFGYKSHGNKFKIKIEVEEIPE